MSTASTPVTTATPSSSPTAFEEICAGAGRKYIMVSGKGGVGKTSLSAALSVRLAQVRGGGFHQGLQVQEISHPGNAPHPAWSRLTSPLSPPPASPQEGHTVLVVSTDPAHSLSDSLAQV